MLVVKKSFLDRFYKDFGNVIEKARKGEEVAGHKYLYRTPDGKGGWWRTYLEDLIKRPIKMLKERFGVSEKKIDNDYEKENIKKDYGADKKTFAQHVLEYFGNRKKWDDRFAKKENRDKFKKPIKMEISKKKPEPKGMESAANEGVQPELDFGEKKAKTDDKKFRANPSLMRKVWSLYTGKTVEQQEKAEQVVEKITEQPEKKNSYAISYGDIARHIDPKTAEKIGEQVSRYSMKNSWSIPNKDIEQFVNEWKNIFDNGNQLVESEKLYKIYSIFEDANYHTECQKLLDGDFDYFTKEFGIKVGENPESEAEKHENRSEAMRGNQNAKKWLSGLSDEERIQLMDRSKYGNFIDAYDRLKNAENKDGVKFNGTDEQKKNAWKKAIGKITRDITQANKDFKELSSRNDGNDYGQMLFNGKIITKEERLSELEGHNNHIEFLKKTRKIMQDMLSEVENGTETERDRISDDSGNIRNGESEGNSNQNVPETESDSDRINDVLNVSESGIGLTAATAISGDSERVGRVTKSTAKKIREQCRELLASKTDAEMTEDDKALLSQYEGAGGLGEKGQSSKAVLTEFYTPRDVIGKIWELVDKYNPNKEKTAIEPSCGIGRFAEGRNEKFTMCEYDATSARIAKILHPEADVKQGAFQNLFMKNNAVIKEYKGEKYDVAVGNPPYTDYNDEFKGMGEGKAHERYETYFMDRTLDTLKDGGIMAFVVPASFLRGGNSKAKEIIAKKGKLLEAWRLPKGTFSSTDFGTDIVVIKKEKGNLEDFNDNKYFTENMSHVIGHEVDGTGIKGTPIKVVLPPEGKTIEEAISMIDANAVAVEKQVEKISESVKTEEVEPKVLNSEVVKPTKPNDKQISNFGLEFTLERKTKSGKTHKAAVVNDNFWAWYKADKESARNELKAKGMYLNKDGNTWLLCSSREPTETEFEKHENRSNAMKGNDNARKIFHVERKEQATKGELFTPSIGENMTAEEFNKKYGKNIPAEDVKFWKKANWEGVINENELSKDELEEIQKSDRFLKTDGGYISTVNYASGNIYQKIDDLNNLHAIGSISDSDFEKRKALLESVLPARKDISTVNLDPKENFIATFDDGEFVKGFSKWLWDADIKSHLEMFGVGIWDINEYMAGKAVRSDNAKDPKSNELKERKAINRKLAAEDLLKKYITTLPKEKRDELEERYNRKFNAIVNPDYRKIPLFVNGMNTHMGTFEFTLTDQQIEGVSRLCNKGNGILAYDVGVGKTVTGIVATVNQLQTGAAKRPLICVPKAVYKNWIKEIKQHFPNQKINELSNLSDSALSKFKDKNGKINLPEGCLNICTYEALEKMTFRPETINGDLAYDMTESQSVHDKDKFGNLLEDTRSERQKASEKEKISKMLGLSVSTKEGSVFFEDLGIDHITVDELHNFKNSFSLPRAYTKSNLKGEDAENVEGNANEYSGIQGASSKRGMKLFAITQLIQQKTNGKGFFGLSATPFNNSPVEIYNILSLVARNRLKEMDIYNMKDFMDAYAEFKMDKVVTAKGDVVQKKVMKSFKKLDSLQALLTEFIDKVDGEEAGVIRPYKQVHLPELDLSPLQKIIMDVERLRIEGKLSNPLKKDGKSDAATLVAMNNMRMACLSPSLIDPKFYADYAQYPGWHTPKAEDIVKESPKLTFVCDSVVKQFKERPTEGQVIYMPRGVGGKGKKKDDDDNNFADNIQGFEEMKKYLVKKGIPSDSVAFLRADTSLDEKERIMSDYNNPDGKIKVIIGSETIKEGVNLNGNSTTLYNTMLGWNPTETTQVEGRIWRQGNKQGITHIVYPLMNDSIDAMMYQKYDEKSSRLNALWSYKGDSLNVEDINPEEMKFKLIKDPKVRAKMRIDEEKSGLDLQLRALNVQYDDFESTRIQYERQKNVLEDRKKPERLQEYYDSIELAKTRVEEKEKELKAAKKTKDEKAIKNAQSSFEYAKSYAIRTDSELKSFLKETKRVEENQKDIENYWRQNGMKSIDEVKERVSKISQQRQDIQKQLDGFDEKREEYEKQAVEQIAAEERNVKHATTAEQVKNVTQSIKDNILPMDADWKAKLKGIVDAKRARDDAGVKNAESKLYERFPGLKKSMDFFVYKGHFYIKNKIKKAYRFF